MRFTIKQAGCGTERVGCVTGFMRSSGAVIETPTSALFTQGGSVVHLTADVLSKVFTNPRLLWVPLSSSIYLEPGVKAQGEGIAKFTAVAEHITCVTLHGLHEFHPQGHFEASRVPLWTKNGKQMITAERYMEVVDVFKPDMILAIADGRFTLDEGNKRISKAVDRTSNMFDVCIKQYKASEKLRNSSLIGVIVGATREKQCDEIIQKILKHKDDLSGIALSGLSDGSEASLKVPTEQLEVIFKRVGDAIPKDLVRIIEGCWNPAVVLAAIEHGWDMFDGSYPLKLTNAGHALALKLDTNLSTDELCILDLSDIRYKEEFKPIQDDCECLACKKHTRAYIRHLLNTREMLASVLLNIHNIHHFDQLFIHARRHISERTFTIFKHHITKQYELYKNSQTTSEVEKKEKIVDVNDHQDSEDIQNNKKVKVSNVTPSNVDKVVNGSA